MPTPTTYTYSIANDFPGGKINSEKLTIAIQYSSILTPLQSINTSGDVVSILFADALSVGDKTTLDGNQSHPAGGLISSTQTSDFLDFTDRYSVIGWLPSASMNSTTDQAIFMTSSKYIVRGIVAFNATGSLGLSVGGMYTGKNKTGNILVPATQVWSALSDATKFLDLTLGSGLVSTVQTSQLVYLSLTVPQLTSLACDIMIFGQDLSA